MVIPVGGTPTIYAGGPVAPADTAGIHGCIASPNFGAILNADLGENTVAVGTVTDTHPTLIKIGVSAPHASTVIFTGFI